MEAVYVGIISAVAGALITGIVSFLIARYNQNRANKREDIRQTNEQKKATFDARPELKIVGYDNYLDRPGYGIKKKVDAEILMVHIDGVTVTGRVSAKYNDVEKDKSKWVCVVYTFENVGKTDISAVDIIGTNKRDTCIFPCENNQHEFYFNNEMLNYSECYDNKIRLGETFTLKVCYQCKEKIIIGTLSAMLAIGMQDSNNNYWKQPLFAPYEKLYDSHRMQWKDYQQDLLIDDAVECFKDPYLW